VPPTPGFSFRSLEDDANHMRLDAAGASYSFWNLNKWRSMGQSRNHGHGDDNDDTTHSKRGRSENDLLKPAVMTHGTDERKASRTEATEEGHDRDRDRGHHGSWSDQRRSYNVNKIWSPPLEERDENEQFLTPPERTLTNQTGSVISRLSSELTASEEGEEKECVKCGSRDFRAKRVSGKQRLLCGRCGRMVDE
jgi:WD repeat-containing protein 44